MTEPAPWKNRAAILAVGLTVNKIMDWPFNYILYPGVIYLLGIWWGGLIMTFLSFIYCLLTIWFYDWSKKDWLGIEAIKGLKNYEGGHSAGRMTSWFLRRSEPVAFLFLTFWYDPFHHHGLHAPWRLQWHGYTRLAHLSGQPPPWKFLLDPGQLVGGEPLGVSLLRGF